MGILAHGIFALKKKAGVLAVVFAFAIIGGALVLIAFRGFWGTEKMKSVEQQSLDSNQQLALANDTNKDSDGDGLKDWEEALYGTNPQKADSDGDGTPDSEEIRLGRDPLKKGPNDTLRQPSVDAGQGTADQTQDTNNLTYNLTKSILESGILGAIDQSGNLQSTDFLQNLTLPPGLDGQTLLASAATIRKSDLAIAPQNDPGSVKQYFNALAAALTKNLGGLTKDDLAIINEAIENNNPSRLTELDTVTSALGGAFRDAKKIPVPRGYEDFAVRELNYLLETKRAVEIERKFYDDPLAALVIIKIRPQLVQEVRDHHLAMKVKLEQVGIVFAPTEDGFKLFSS